MVDQERMSSGGAGEFSSGASQRGLSVAGESQFDCGHTSPSHPSNGCAHTVQFANALVPAKVDSREE